MATSALTPLDVDRVESAPSTASVPDAERTANAHADRINRLIAALEQLIEDVDTNVADIEARLVGGGL